jgi:hypothetical protein
MGRWCPKHVDALNLNQSESESETKVCIKLVVFITQFHMFVIPAGASVAAATPILAPNSGKCLDNGKM